MKNSSRKSIHTRFSSFWWGESGPSAHLLLLFLAFMLAPLLSSDLGRFLSTFFFSLILLSGIATVSKRLLPRIGAGIVALLTFVLIWLKHFNPESHFLQTASAIVSLCYLAMLTWVFIQYVFQDGPVTGSRVQGAVVTYILIGLTWSAIYRLIELQLPGALFVTPTAAGQSVFVKDTEFTYFSFVTLTTLGYGDIIPVHPTARLFVIFEALIGQLFPATLLARLVSLQVSSSGRDSDK